ncbi:MAG: FmdB family zinc ribbon protein [Sphaerochaetaceae bacterium]|jgi:putative FmdB family regulatory protein
MPYYEYECDACHETFTLEQPIMNHDAPEKCPKCGIEHKVHRVFTPSSVIFKGSGFYCTDHHDGGCSCGQCAKQKGK